MASTNNTPRRIPQHPSQNEPTQSQGFSNSSGTPDDENIALAGAITKRVSEQFFLDVAKATTPSELAKCIPVPGQPRAKAFFEKAFHWFQKRGTLLASVAQWNDVLATKAWSKVPALNSIKFPTMQASKDALASDQGELLQAMNFDTIVNHSKKSILEQMIKAKDKEIEIFDHLTSLGMLKTKVHEALHPASELDSVTPEHIHILTDPECLSRVCKVLSEIGMAACTRSLLAKEKRVEQKQEADIEMTDVGGAVNQKRLAILIDEKLRSREQSRRDKGRSGKGKPGSASRINKKQKRAKEKKGSSKVAKSKGKGRQGTSRKGQLKRS